MYLNGNGSVKSNGGGDKNSTVTRYGGLGAGGRIFIKYTQWFDPDLQKLTNI